MEIPDYVDILLRSDPPPDCRVQKNTYPSVGSGRLEDARVATIGINPAKGRHRPPTPTKDDLIEEWKCRRGYLSHRENWSRYHTSLEQVLKACGASYLDFSAASLDIVQWATTPKWSKLDKSAKEKLLDKSKPFLTKVLGENPNIELLLGNGKSVIQQVERSFNVSFKSEKVDGTSLYYGQLLGRQFIGWGAFLSNCNLKGWQRENLADRVGKLYQELKA